MPVVMLVTATLAGPASTAAAIHPRRTMILRAAPYVPDQLLVRFRGGVDARTAAALASRVGATTVKSFPFVPGLRLLHLRAGLSVPSAVGAFSRLSRVVYAQPNWVSHIDHAVGPRVVATTPNDPRYGDQWDWPKIDAPDAWDRSIGSKRVVVGDIDTGISYRHEDLKANVWKNTAECMGRAGVDDDGNGYVDDCRGIDTIDGDTDPIDDNGHGTHTAGTIGAVGNNGVGVTGLNWKIEVLSCKSHDSSGNGSTASIIECYQYMVTEKAAGNDIIATNNSYDGCPEACDFDEATRDGIAAMDAAGIMFAVSAGNDGQDNDTSPKYPTNYFLPNVISAAATTSTDGLAGFSNYGDRSVMIGAPGVGVLSTYLNDGYADLSGTSMASPHVAGLAALLHSFDPSLTIYQIRNLILAGGDDIASLDGKAVSGNRLNAHGAMTCSGGKLFGLLRPLDTTTGRGQPIAALNIDCADDAGRLKVTVEPGAITLRLRDDGKNGDLAAHDGVYSAKWKPAANGTYELKFSNGKTYAVTVA